MSASGKTNYFNIPIYQVGDTCEYIPSYNEAMTIIDTQMQDNKTLASQNQANVSSLEKAVTNQGNQIQEINTALPNLQKWEALAMSGNTQNNITADCTAFLTNNFITFNGRFSKPYTSVANVPVKIQINNLYLIPYASTPGNLYNIAEGASNYKNIGNCLVEFRETIGGATIDLTLELRLKAWVINGVTYFGLTTSTSNTDLIGSIIFTGGIYPLNYPDIIPTAENNL